MIFSHAPAGFLVAYFTRKIWSKNLSQKQINLLYLLAAFFGILPDLDALYFYFVSAAVRHRELVTHSFILYLFVFLTLYFYSHFLKNTFLKAFSIVFFLSTLSHLLLDSLGSGAMWLFPFLSLTFGLLNFDFLNAGFYGRNFFFVDMTLEAVIFLMGLNILFFLFFKKYLKRIFAASYIFFLLVIFLLYISWPYLLHGEVYDFHKDNDKDGKANLEDQDMDGDGLDNIKDVDADGDGLQNNKEIIEAAKKMEGVFYDKSEGGIFEMPVRFGLLGNADVIRKSYEAAGIFLRDEMALDFEKNPYLYDGSPRHSKFEHLPYNYFIFFKKNGMIKETRGMLMPADIVFYGEQAKKMALVIVGGNTSGARVLIAEPDKVKIDYHKNVAEKNGEARALARMKYETSTPAN